MFSNTSAAPFLTAVSKSASSRMMLADLPPSSWATRLTVGAAFCATRTPARVEPVKDIMSTSGCWLSAVPTPGPSPLTRLNTPAGTPAASRISAKIIASNGAISLGLSTIVQPAARAGATLTAIWFIGQFQGVIRPQTPMGSLTISVVRLRSSNSNVLSARSAALMCCGPLAAWAFFARPQGAPISSMMASATSSWRFANSARIASSRAIRSSRVVCEYVAKARLAAATARSTSAADPRLIRPQTSSVAGLMTSSGSGDTGSTHWPSM